MRDMIEMVDSCGIEIESENILPQKLKFSNKCWRITDDASVTSDVNTILGSNIVIERIGNKLGIEKIIPVKKQKIGLELVSFILNSTDESFLNTIKDITNILISFGESSESNRAGIHYHISLPNPNLRTLKSIIRLGKYFEALFFNIGGMGYKYRGYENDSVYCRPITRVGPPCVRYYHGGFVQVFNIYDLLKTKKQEDFWNLYGDMTRHGGRYNPIRYTWLNLYPLCPITDQYRGTLEFRLFNKTLNPLFINSTLKMCKKFVEYAITSSFSSLKEENLLKENSIYDKSITKEDLKNHLDYFAYLTDLEKEDLEVLNVILDRTPLTEIEPTYIYTHLRNDYRDYWEDRKYIPRIIPRDDIKTPVFFDIHNIRNSGYVPTNI